MSRDCTACFKLLPNDGRFMTCSECTSSYHLHGCSGIADNTFNTMGPSKREKWRCRACRAVDGRSGNVGANAASQPDNSTLALQLATMNEKLDLLSSVKSSVDLLLQLPAKVDDLLLLKPSVEKMKETVRDVEKAISFFSERYDSLLAREITREKEVKTLQSEVVSLQSAVSDQAATIERLRSDINESEQYSRRSNLEIHGLPCADGENLFTFLTDLARDLDVGLQPSEVLAVHRLPGKHTAVPPILVRFSSVVVRERLMNTRKKLRSLGRDPSAPKLYFNDNLSRANRELFWMARTRGREMNYQFVWVRNAKIFAKKAEGSPLVRITHFRDLEKMV